MSNTAPGTSVPVVGGPSLDQRAHVVQFYERDEFLLEELTRFVGAGLGEGEAVIIIATKAHLDGLEKGLQARGVDTAVACQHGRYIALDAVETLAKLTPGGVIDEARFAAVVGSAIATAVQSHGHVRAFGEMVALLWAKGKREDALRLEEMWNDLARTQTFALLCAYPMTASVTPRTARRCSKFAERTPASSPLRAT